VFAIACSVVALPLAWTSWKVFEVAMAKFVRSKLASRRVPTEAVRAT
jgi:peptidoglycan/LPS O-acetylase OafA/YrhL